MGIEINENGHTDGSEIKEQERERVIKEAAIKLIRINPDKKDFDIDDEIGEIQDFIYKSGVKLGEQSEKHKIVEDLERTTKIIKPVG